MFLATTNQSIEVLLGGAITTNQLAWQADYVDTSTSTFSATGIGSANGATNNTTAVTMVSAPSASTTRQLLHLIVSNADTASATVTVRLNDTSTYRQSVKVTLATLESLTYEAQAGWRVIDASGNIKVTSLAVYSADEVTLHQNGYQFSAKTNGISNAYLSQMGANTLKGNNTGSTANASDLTVANVLTLLGVSTIVPQGRLTLTSATPVMITDTTAASAVYYTPYNGNIIPIYDGSVFIFNPFTQLTLTLNTSNHLSGKVYDVFVFLNSGTVTVAAGPAWTSDTARSAAIAMINGIWTNNASINLTNGSTTYSSISANQATYVGTFRATANGQTQMAFRPNGGSGGNNCFLGVYNGYNRVTVSSRSVDTNSYSYTTAVWRSTDSSNSHRASFVDGLGQSFVLVLGMQTSTASGAAQYSYGLDSTTTPSASITAAYSSAGFGTMTVVDTIPPQIGFHYVQSLESGASGVTFYNSSIGIQLEM